MRNWIAAFAAVLALACPAWATVTGNPPPASYTCNGTTTNYTVPFPYLAQTDLVVTVGTTTLIRGTDYTVTPTTAPSTGTVKLVAGGRCGVGATLTITRSVALTQPQSFRTGAYKGADHEQAHDREEMQIQQNAATHATDKAAQATKDAAQDLSIGGVFNAVSALNGVSHSATDVSSVLAFGSTTPRTLTTWFADVANVKAFGAIGDGVANDTAALQAALNTGKMVFVPPGTYSVTGLTAVAGGGIYALGETATIKLAVGSTVALTIAVPNFTVRGLRFDGGNQGPYDVTGTVAGTRSGIWAAGPNVGAGIYNVSIEDCYATGFDNNGLYFSNTAQATGGEPGQPVANVTGFTAYHNFNGIFLDQLGEYVQLTNVNSSFAFAAIRVIGGNNRVVNSHFSKSWRNLMMRTGSNLAHGSFTASSFNHQSANSGALGVDITLFGNQGELFTGCEFFSTNVQITDSGGIVITGSVFNNSLIQTIWSSTAGLTANMIVNNNLQGSVPRAFSTSPNMKLVYHDNTIDTETGPTALTYGATVNVDATANSTGSFTVTPTNGTAFTLANPTNPSVDARLMVQVVNTFGTLGALTFGTAYKLASPWVQPPNGSTQAIVFVYDLAAGLWTETARSGMNAASFPNGLTSGTTLGVTGASTLTGGVTIGSGGSTISKLLRGTVVWNPGVVASNTLVTNFITVTGAVAGSDCVAGVVDPAPVSGFPVQCLTTADTCNVGIRNQQSASFTFGSATFYCLVFNH